MLRGSFQRVLSLGCLSHSRWWPTLTWEPRSLGAFLSFCRTHTHSCTHTHVHTHVYTRTHTNTHMHTHILTFFGNVELKLFAFLPRFLSTNSLLPSLKNGIKNHVPFHFVQSAQCAPLLGTRHQQKNTSPAASSCVKRVRLPIV